MKFYPVIYIGVEISGLWEKDKTLQTWNLKSLNNILLKS